MNSSNATTYRSTAPSSTPQPPTSQSGAYSGYPPNPPNWTSQSKGYAGGPYQTPIPKPNLQPSNCSSSSPNQSIPVWALYYTYQQPQQHPPTLPFLLMVVTLVLISKLMDLEGQTYPPPQGQPQPARGGYPPYSRPSPYRVDTKLLTL
ncbi:uncharacterized protein LOC121392821 [Gigantopelta aegis]|uniref:uncharacterized protein LOC121392821 n=1 Tax=Gigantopelta aegis TaxID=1735272 RepID=UPI001B88BD81|nr:uncharacterized protein LOC121392821 [Gigantopelta aegis]